MAITPRSFRLNPTLLIIVLAAAFCVWAVATCPIGDRADVSFGTCAPDTEQMALWSDMQWANTVHCLMENDQGEVAYQAASMAVLFHQSNRALLNLKGYVAARNGDHATAIYDFRTGQRVTGSPSGVFENNIAWATLFRTNGLRFQRQERVLLQTRELYEQSLEKGSSCERLHTALFVEYKYADLVAQNAGSGDQRVAEALRRYLSLFEAYMPCTTRLRAGDELVVEEVMSAAAMDVEMGRIADIERPTRHLWWAHAAKNRAQELGLTIDADWCRRTTPVETAARTCAEF